MEILAAVLAGGLGTRSANPNQAKISQLVGGRSLLAWQIDSFSGSAISEVCVVGGHFADQVLATINELKNEFDFQFVIEQTPQGTVNAVKSAFQKSGLDRALVVLGDLLVATDLENFVAEWVKSGKHVGVMVHPSTHPQDSDAVFEHWDGSVSVVAKGGDRAGIPNMSSAGIFTMTRGAIGAYGDCKDIGSNVLPAAAKRDDLFAFVTSGYVKDTGTPDRLERARHDAESGVIERRGKQGDRKVLFLDRDGVINPVSPEIYSPDGYVLNIGVAQLIQRANSEGIPVFAITNQPGIAKGLMTFQEHETIRAEMDRLLGEYGAFVDDYFYCPHHPDSGFEGEVSELKISCDCRKPEPGLVVRAAAKHGVDLLGSVFVGDTWRDQEVAEKCGIPFIHVTEECSLDGEHVCADTPSEAIKQAIDSLLC